jgi:hypothetical protein
VVKNNLDSKLSSKIASRKASLIETSRFLSKNRESRQDLEPRLTRLQKFRGRSAVAFCFVCTLDGAAVTRSCSAAQCCGGSIAGLSSYISVLTASFPFVH